MSFEARKSAYRLGRFAEGICCWRLRLKGYRILQRDFRAATGEIDIIARRANVLAFIEVKARSTRADALFALGPQQRRRIEKTACAYLSAHPDLQNLDARFDLMAFAPWRVPVHLTGAWITGE